MKTLIAKLVWPAYLIGVIFLSYAGVNAYLNASSIMSDHTVVDAPIELTNTTSRTKKGHTSITYCFNYSYTVGDQDYVSQYSAVNEKGERYLDEPVIAIAYSNGEPANSGVLHVLKRQSSLGDTVKRILMAAFLLALIALAVHAWASPDEDDEDEKPPDVAPGKQSQTAGRRATKMGPAGDTLKLVPAPRVELGTY